MIDKAQVKDTIKGLCKDLVFKEFEFDAALYVVIREIASRVDLPALQEDTTISGSASVWEYALDTYVTDFDRTRTVYWDVYEVDPRSKEAFDEEHKPNTASTGTPEVYTVWNGKLQITPIPSSAKTIYLSYQKVISSLSEIDDKYIDVVIAGIARDLYNPDTQGYLKWQRRFERAIAKPRSQIGIRRPRREPDLYHQRRNVKIADM